MGSTAARPLGVTVVALMVIFQGVFSIVIGLSLTEVISLLPVPADGSASATGSAMIIAGILNTVIGLGLFSMRFWAYVIALLFLGLTVLAGFFALIQHGIDSDSLPSLLPAVIAAIVLAYMFSERVRPYYDRD